MKSFLAVCFLLVFASFQSCDTTKTVSDSPADKLADVLRGVSGLSVLGRGESAVVKVRGLADYSGDGQPLFVVDGLEITGGFYALANKVGDREIKSVRVLRTASDTYKYGGLGVNGVVEISTL